MKRRANRVLSVLLSVLMLASVVPSTVLATFDYNHNASASTDNYYSLISKNDWAIAPGINESEIVINNEAGDRRQVIHLMEADISNPYTRVISSYTNMDTSNYAISTIPEHAAFLEKEWGENVVGAMNTCLSWYNSATYIADPSRVNEPLGFMMVDGKVLFDHSVGFPTCIVIHKDTNENGETRPESIPKVEMRTVTSTDNLNGWEDQVIPCSSGYIVKDGVNQHKPSHGTDTAARSVVGVKADGSIVIMMNDGRLAPMSLGMNMYECAEVMIAAGCVYAANCDGGGSSTFMSERPGEELKVNCSPCDGSLRANTHGIMFISTAPATGEFDNAYLDTESDYYTPFSKVTINAVGRDFSGAEADIPADAVMELKDSTFGTVSGNVFVSNGKTGAVTVEMKVNGEVVGSTTFNVVNPEVAGFLQTSTVIPYGKEVAMDLVVKYGEFDVTFSADDFTFELSDASAATIDGLKILTTNDSSKKGVKVTATYKYADLGSSTMDITYGKGSEILFNFENGNVSDWLGIDAVIDWAKLNAPTCPVLDPSPYGGNLTPENNSTVFLATAENGKVKNGEYSLGLELDFTNSGSFGQWSYNNFFYVGDQVVLRDTAKGQNATRLGMWMYIPEELAPGASLAMQTELYCGSSSTNYSRKNTHLILECCGKTLTSVTEADIPEDRWVYCYMDLSAYNFVATQDPYNYISTRREPQFIRFYTATPQPFNAVFYIDDITLDYSSAVDDRNAPIISNVEISVSGTNIRSFMASVADYAANNASGLDVETAKIYIDGVLLNDVECNGSKISSPEVTLLAGKHTVTFEISDKLGNKTKKSQQFTIEGTAEVILSGHNNLNNVPQYDSVYYVDIEVKDFANIEKITTDIYLNFANTWELDNMIVADGFKAEYKLDKYTNVATITITSDGKAVTGAGKIVSIPVRVWSWDAEDSGYEASAVTDAPLVNIIADVRMGKVEFKDNTEGTFDGALNVKTALTDIGTSADWHMHTATDMKDVSATCTEDGYEGRTYCDVCGSVVDWGTKFEATGHNYEVIDGKLSCECGELFNGEYTDGNTYINGVIADGWVKVDGVDTYYYVNGKMVTGSIVIDKAVYTFDENGVYLSNNVFNGFIEADEGLMYFYANTNYEKEYLYINDKAYYFADGIARDGEYVINGEKCIFEDGLYKSCSTADVIDAGWEGTSVTYIIYADGSFVLGGEGATYKYTSRAAIPWTEYKNQVKSIFIGKDITVIDQFALAETYFAKTITFEEGSKLHTIGAAAFLSNYGITEIVLPESLEYLNQNSFKMCKKLANVVIPHNIKYISFHAFVNNGNKIMENISLSVVEGTVGHDFAVKYNVPFTFYQVAKKAVASGTCGENATWTLYNDGELAIGGSGAIASYANKYEQPWAAYANQIKSIVIGKDITAIGNYAFAYLYFVEEVTFEEGGKLEKVGAVAFHYASRLKSVTLPETVKSIGNLAFGYSSKLTNVYIPQDITSISSGAFTNSNNVKLNVAEGTFGETYAKNNNIPYETREYVYHVIASGTCGENATWEFYNNGELVIGGSGAIASYANKYEQPWAAYANQIKSIVIGKDITAIGNYAFAYLYFVEEVTFEEGGKLEKVGAVAFHYASRLKSVTLPETVKSIGNLAFGYSSKLTNVYIPQDITSIVAGAFTNSNKVKLNVAEGTLGETYAKNNNIPYETREYVYHVIASGTCGENATWEFYNNGELVISGSGAIASYANKYEQPWAAYANQIKSIVIGKDITAIGNYAFAYLYFVEEVTFEEGSKLEKVGAVAFHYASRLKSVTLPETVTYVGNLAFGYSSKLTTVYIPENATVHANAFLNSPNVNIG